MKGNGRIDGDRIAIVEYYEEKTSVTTGGAG